MSKDLSCERCCPLAFLLIVIGDGHVEWSETTEDSSGIRQKACETENKLVESWSICGMLIACLHNYGGSFVWSGDGLFWKPQ